MIEEAHDDSDASFEPPKTTARKRKSTSGVSTSKKAKFATSSSSASSGVLNKQYSELASSVLANGANFYTKSENQDAASDAAVTLAGYTKQLEVALGEALKSSGGIPAAEPKTGVELTAAAGKIRKAAVSGIKKQMSWKPSCKTNSSKWSYDGLCADRHVFATVLRLDGPITWKMKKFTKDEFENALGNITASVRYDTLRITSDINVRYNSESGEFKFSGSYGRGY
ncbi:hypothetical protein F5879DRAFT_487962 [Lentinula edodes]|nr:hypothetical protein F5879DRAFT_487962 [Lentinula edodes]